MKDWIIESHDISENFIYKDLEYGAVPSDYYMKKAYNIVKRRIALGGYRLAEIIKKIKKAFDEIKSEDINENFLAAKE